MKKMNNLFKKICLWSLVVTMASCDFLDTKPYDFVAPETFYQNEKDCTMALAGVYYTLVKGTVYGNNYSLMFSNTDDLSYFAREFDGNPVRITVQSATLMMLQMRNFLIHGQIFMTVLIMPMCYLIILIRLNFPKIKSI